MGLNTEIDQTQPPILVQLLNVPKTYVVMRPFTVKVQIFNRSDAVLNGTMTVQGTSDGLMLVGEAPFQFADFKQKTKEVTELTFVSLCEGFHQFPPFSFKLESGETHENAINEGVLIVGYTP
jgi:hypothetical protein